MVSRGALSSMLRSKKFELTPTGTPRSDLDPIDVRKERMDRDLDEEDIYNLESHVAKAGRIVMRGRLAEAVNLPRTHTRGAIQHVGAMDLTDIGGTVTGHAHKGSESMNNLPGVVAGSFNMLDTNSNSNTVNGGNMPISVPVDDEDEDLEDPNSHSDLYFKLKVPTSTQLFKEVAPQGAVDRYTSRLNDEANVVSNAVSAMAKAFGSRSSLLEHSNSNLNFMGGTSTRQAAAPLAPHFPDHSTSNIPTLPMISIPGSEVFKNEPRSRSKAREDLINRVKSAEINPNPVQYALKHVKLAELPGKKLHPTVSKNSLG